MAESKRAFIAVHFSKELIESLADLQDRLRSSPRFSGGIKWVKPGNIHLTLQFLGQVDGELIPILSEDLSGPFADIQPFEVTLAGTGAFPSPRRPRVVWAGFSSGTEQLVELQRVVCAVTGAQGFECEKRPFKPHVTLGRARNPKRVGDISGQTEPLAGQVWGSCQIDEVCLMASKLTPAGAVYSTLDSFLLGR